jgi:Protein of unknown function (DUF2911)
MVRPARFELATSRFGGVRSIQLSYGRALNKNTTRPPGPLEIPLAARPIPRIFLIAPKMQVAGNQRKTLVPNRFKEQTMSVSATFSIFRAAVTNRSTASALRAAGISALALLVASLSPALRAQTTVTTHTETTETHTTTMPAADGNKPLPSPPAQASITLNGKSVTIDYSAPSLRGRKMIGGMNPYGQVWRTGANAATTLKTAVDLKVGDLMVPAGTYTLYSVPSETTWKLIVNKQTGQWGTIYDEKQDLGRTDMQTGPAPSAPLETFAIKFENGSGAQTELHLMWAGVDVFVPVVAH